MKRTVSCILMLCLLLSTAIMPTVSAAERRGLVFVSTTGKDSAEGTIDAPLATLQAAQKKVRAMRASGNYPDGITVFVRGGNYSLNEPLILTEEDSGTETCPINWRNYEDETVTFTAGVTVAGSKFQKVTDQAILNRVVDKNARDQIYSLDLKQFGINDPGEPYLFGSNSYSTSITETGIAKQPDAPGMEIFYNNKAMTNARYPNDDWLLINTVIAPGWDFDAPEAYPKGTPFTITVADDRLRYWVNAPEDSILMFGYWKWDWGDQALPLHKIDVAASSITSKWHSVFSVKPGQRFYVYNLIEELDLPGEYYLDRENSRLYINPPSDLKNAEVTLTVMEEVPFQIDGASYITFKGIDVKGARNHAFRIKTGDHNSIIDCELSFTAKTAVEIQGGRYNGVSDSYIHDVDGGVSLAGGDLSTLVYCENYAINNHFERFARLTAAYMPAIALRGVGDLAAHNEIHDAAHQAISWGGQSNRIYYNNIYDVLKDTDDAGVIYGGLSWHSRGQEIKYNYIHDCDANNDKALQGIWGIYGDGGQCEMYVCGNIIENIAGDGIILNGGWDSIVLNNYLINVENGVDVTNVVGPKSFQTHHWPRLEPYKDIIMNSAAWREKYPTFFAMMEVSDEEKGIPHGNVVANNISYKCPIVTQKAYGNATVESNLELKSDPGFMDMANRDYNLKADSYLFDQLPGFQALPFSRMGRIDDLAYARVQDAVVMTVGSPRGMVGGKLVPIDEESLSVAPFIDGDRTYVPLRFLSESLGAGVNFADGVITISDASVNLEMKLNSTEAKKNGETITLEKAPVVIDGRTMVPLRQVSELLDKQVFWDPSGFISISDDEALFDVENGDDVMIDFLREKVKYY